MYARTIPDAGPACWGGFDVDAAFEAFLRSPEHEALIRLHLRVIPPSTPKGPEVWEVRSTGALLLLLDRLRTTLAGTPEVWRAVDVEAGIAEWLHDCRPLRLGSDVSDLFDLIETLTDELAALWRYFGRAYGWSGAEAVAEALESAEARTRLLLGVPPLRRPRRVPAAGR